MGLGIDGSDRVAEKAAGRGDGIHVEDLVDLAEGNPPETGLGKRGDALPLLTRQVVGGVARLALARVQQS